MNVEYLRDNHNGVNEHGDVVPLHDLELEDAVIQIDHEIEVAYASSIEDTIRNHPAAHDMSEPEISKLAQDLIDDLRQQHKRRRKARAIFAVIRNPSLSSEDRSAIAAEAGLPVDVFEEQPEKVQLSASTAMVNENNQAYEQSGSDFADWRKAAANDRD